MNGKNSNKNVKKTMSSILKIWKRKSRVKAENKNQQKPLKQKGFSKR